MSQLRTTSTTGSLNANSIKLEAVGANTVHLVTAAEKELINKSIETFNGFDANAHKLDHKLRMLGSSMQLIGISVGVLNATYHLRKALMRLQFLVRENAACLHEGQIKPNTIKNIHDVKPDMKISGRIDMLQPREKNTHKPKQTIFDGMDQMATDVRIFLDRVNEISEFEDELLNKYFLLFEAFLQKRSEALKRNFAAQLRQRSFKDRINKLAAEFSTHLNDMTEALGNFLESGVPTIRHSQDHIARRLQALSAVAVFFSGVTASTIQYSIGDGGDSMQSVVNGLWIMSLACSVASAISAQVVYHWRTSRFSSPSRYAPTILTYKLKVLPLAYLCCSGFTFLIGLSVFTFSSDQHVGIRVSVTVFIGLVLCQLLYMGIWFGLERLAYSRTQGESWFYQLLPDLIKKLHWRIGSNNREDPQPNDVESGEKPAPPGSSGSTCSKAIVDSTLSMKREKQLSAKMAVVVKQIIAYRRGLNILRQHKLNSQYFRTPSSYPFPSAKPLGLNLEYDTVQDGHSALIKYLGFSPKGDFLATCGWDGCAVIWSVGDVITAQLTLHHAPYGNTLVTSPVIAATIGFDRPRVSESHVRQVTWSYDGKMIATRTENAIWVWKTMDGTLPRRFEYDPQKRDIPRSKGIAWLPSGSHIVSLERDPFEQSSITCIEIETCHRTNKPIEGIKVYSIAVVDNACIIAAGVCLPIQLTPLNQGEIPPAHTDTEMEKILLCFNFLSGQTKSKAPLSGEVRGIAVTVETGRRVLVLTSYRTLDARPELWKINLGGASPEFLHQRTYFAQASVNFSGRGCFGGLNNKYVCCSSQDGKIFIWNRDSGLLLKTIKPPSEEHIKFFTCNSKDSPDLLCVAGAVDGLLTIWSSCKARESPMVSTNELVRLPQPSLPNTSSPINLFSERGYS